MAKEDLEAAGEEQPDKLRKTVRFEQEASTASASSDPTVALEYLASGETQSFRGPYLRRSQVMLTTTYKFLRWIHSTRWMDERVVTSEKCWSGIEEKMREISREVNFPELDENLTCLNAFEVKFWKSDQKVVIDETINPKILMDEKSWKTRKSNQNDVMDEKLVQNSVMNEEMVQIGVINGKFVKNFVMNATIDPKVVMDLSIFESGGWNSLQPINQNLLEEFIDENEP